MFQPDRIREDLDMPDTVAETNRMLFEPNVVLNGPIEEETVAFFLERLADVRSGGQDLVVELNTVGGDAEAARRIALEVRLFSAHSGHDAYCVGKTYVYSAGVTIMAGFKTSNRFLTSDAVLLIHERRIQQSLELVGPMAACIQIVREKLSMLEMGQRLERQSFEELVKESRLSVRELFECAASNCYLTAQEALDYGLIGKILS
jgi:ATP-dependent Clp protease protease subunit